MVTHTCNGGPPRGEPDDTQLEGFEMDKSKNKHKKLAEMSAVERAVAGCSNPRPTAKPRTRFAVVLNLSRR